MTNYLESSTSGTKFFTSYLLSLIANFHGSEILYIMYLETLRKINLKIFSFNLIITIIVNQYREMLLRYSNFFAMDLLLIIMDFYVSEVFVKIDLETAL